MADLTELGLRKPSAVVPSPAPAAAPPASASGAFSRALSAQPAAATPISSVPTGATAAGGRGDAFATFLDRVLDVVGQFAPEADAGEREGFQERLREYRGAVADSARRADLPAIADACVGVCRAYLQGSRAYLREREQELTEVITILQDAAKLSVGSSAEFHAQVIESSDRFNRIAELENIRELRKRMNDEVGTLRRAVVEKQQKDDAAYAQLSTRVETLQKKLAEMEVEATLDPLTKVGNRRRFQTSLSRMFSAAQQSGTTLSLAMIDVDHFKVVNDTHGHPIGDRVLVCVAQWITQAIRQSDVVARYGGEEFAVLIPGATAAEVEGRFKQLLLDVAGSAFEYDVLGRKEKVRFTISCGLVDFEASDTEETLVKRADEALYEAKRKGRNRVITRKKSLIGKMLAWG